MYLIYLGKEKKYDPSDNRTQNTEKNIPQNIPHNIPRNIARNVPFNEEQKNNNENISQNITTPSFDWKIITTTIQKYAEIVKMWCIKLLAKILSLSPEQSMYLAIAVVAFLLYFLVYSGSSSNYSNSYTKVHSSYTNPNMNPNINSNYMGGKYSGTGGTGSRDRGGAMPQPVYRSTNEQDNVYTSDHTDRPKIDRNKYHNTRDDFSENTEYGNRESRFHGNENGRNGNNRNYESRNNYGRNSNSNYETSYGYNSRP